jgi:flagellar motility protein MotE (MotC chaperone)
MVTKPTTPETTVELHTRPRRRLLPYLPALVLITVLLGLVGFFGRLPFPATGTDTATAGEKAPASTTGAKAAAPREAPATPKAEPLLTLSAGDIPVLQSMQERQAHLDAREQQLVKREEELRVLQQQVEEKLSRLTTLRKEVGALFEEKEAFDEKRFEHLVKVYEGMKPEEAASLVERLSEDTAVKMLFRMKDKKVGQILGFVKPEVAVKLSEHLAAQRQKDYQKATPNKEKS